MVLSQEKTFPVIGMSCAACAGSVESVLMHTEGVAKAEVNFASNTVKVNYAEVSEESLKKALQDVGYDLDIESEDVHAASQEQAQMHYRDLKKRTLFSALFSLPVFILGMFFPEWSYGSYLSAVLALPVLFVWGRSFYSNAFKQAKAGNANMDTLVALSTGIAYFFSLFNTLYPEFFESRGLASHVYYEAAVVIITFISLGKTLEEKAKSGTTAALEKLMDLQVKKVFQIGQEGLKEIDIQDLNVGDLIRVQPGNRIPVDGAVAEGDSYVDESMLSGESLPVAKQAGDAVYSGTLNQKGSLDIRVVQVGEETLLHKIIRAVRDAQGSKAPVQKQVDKIASIFVPTILVLSLLTFGVWYFSGVEEAFSKALYTALAVLVIACPCALGLATPTAIMVGIGKGAEHNILIRDAQSLEMAQEIDTLVLDKTGTITQGKAQVNEVVWQQERGQLMEVLAAMEEHSEHPMATALLRYAREQGAKSITVDHFESIQGKGICASYQGHNYGVGNAALIAERASSINLVNYQQDYPEKAGKTRVYFFTEELILGHFDIGDRLKEGSAEAIQRLQEAGLELYILSGDNKTSTAYWAHQLGISHYRAGVLPQDKAQELKALQAQGKKVAMIGDGINDSQALAEADLSIAMGHGSDIAMDVAQMTLMSSDLRSIPKAFKLSKFILKGIRQNLFWAFIYNLIGIPIAAGILYPWNGFLLDPMIAGAAMAFSSVSVVLNSLRLKQVNLN